MSRRIECRSEGCTHEVLFKTVDGAFDDRRGSGRPPLSPIGRGSPSGPHHRHGSSSIQVSPYCKQHTCIHFHGDERCVYKKPPHDTVCAIHARCPVPNCTQARAQFLEPSFDPLSNAVPKYARFEVCSDHQCKTAGCRAIAESAYPYCANRRSILPHGRSSGVITNSSDIQCQMNGCKEPRHPSARAHEYLAFYCCAALACQNPRDRTSKPENCGRYCPLHTCRVERCQAQVDTLALFCTTHFKDHYIAQGKQLCIDRNHHFPNPIYHSLPT
ncbi:hypothetical protein C8A01DRAFT_15758 [Parachaetomium inaequale]|uniref:Uncharacterized protein n=1 Tax=Parachaetomium inaequale TaxID=2588326 RepID=A0AAN6PHX7_9PEZI|nr:hypothetical protein C8A01DRAFT_15758 [Parachaetomium inaequale]